MNVRKIKTPKVGEKIYDWIFVSELNWPYCLFKCKCGKEKKVVINTVLSGQSKSCGCEKKHLRKGFEEISGTYWCNKKLDALKRNLDFFIEKEYAWNLYLSQNKKCALSGVELSFATKKEYNKTSIDRIDSQKGYIINNVQWVSQKINIMKWKLNQDLFLFFCKKISDFNSFYAIKNMTKKEENIPKNQVINVDSIKKNEPDKAIQIKNIKAGDKFWRLTFLESVKVGKNKKYKFLCDCGNEIISFFYPIKNGRTKSCGCYKKDVASKTFWKGHEDIGQKFWGDLIRNAKKRKIEFNITKEYVWDLFLRQNKKCALSGLDISFKKNIFYECSIDRINSNKGYVKGNIQLVVKEINYMKNKTDNKEFIDMCKKITEFKYKEHDYREFN